MKEYDFKFKLKVVKEYLTGNYSYASLTEKYHINSNGRIHQWVALYNSFGEEGLKKSQNRTYHSFQFKLHAVKLYLKTGVSYQNLALFLGIKAPSTLVKWVRRYRDAGIDGLKSRRKGSRPKMNKLSMSGKPNMEPDKRLQQLEEENLKLRIENAYLKELRRLRLAKERQKSKQGLSTISEDSSN